MLRKVEQALKRRKKITDETLTVTQAVNMLRQLPYTNTAGILNGGNITFRDHVTPIHSDTTYMPARKLYEMAEFVASHFTAKPGYASSRIKHQVYTGKGPREQHYLDIAFCLRGNKRPSSSATIDFYVNRD